MEEDLLEMVDEKTEDSEIDNVEQEHGNSVYVSVWVFVNYI